MMLGEISVTECADRAQVSLSSAVTSMKMPISRGFLKPTFCIFSLLNVTYNDSIKHEWLVSKRSS
jgi:hypothetical protein